MSHNKQCGGSCGAGSGRSAVLRPRRLSRRSLLRGMLSGGGGLLLAACGGSGLDPFAAPPSGGGAPPPDSGAAAAGQAAADAQIQQAQAAVEQAATAAVQQTEPAEPLPTPHVYITPRPTPQGHTVLIIADAPGAAAAAIAWEGEAYALIPEGDRFFGFIGIDALTPPGPMPLSIAVWAPNGDQLLWQETVLDVEAVDWSFDDIQIDVANAALLAPEIRQADLNARTPYQRFATPQRHWSGIFDPPSEGTITAGYGELRSFNGGPISEYHSGIDFAGPNGAPITAPGSGVVSWSGRTERRGNGMIIDHGAGVFTGYYHLSALLMSAGDVVERGAAIGRIGSTGLATGPHLHWEVVVRGVTVNPVPWLRLLEAPDPLQELDPVNAITAANLAAAT